MRLQALTIIRLRPDKKLRRGEEFEVSDELGARYLRRGDARLADGETTPAAKPKVAVAFHAPKVGDLVQVEIGGALQLEEPAAITAIHEHGGQTFVMVEGSSAGIPVEQIVVPPPAKRKATPRTKRAKPAPETSDLPAVEPEQPAEPAE